MNRRHGAWHEPVDQVDSGRLWRPSAVPPCRSPQGNDDRTTGGWPVPLPQRHGPHSPPSGLTTVYGTSSVKIKGSRMPKPGKKKGHREVRKYLLSRFASWPWPRPPEGA